MKIAVVLFVFLIIFLSAVIYVLFPFFKDAAGDNYDKRIIVKGVTVSSSSQVEWYHYSYIGDLGPEIIEFKKGNKRKIICKSEYISDVYFRNDSLIFQFWFNNIKVLRDIHYVPELKIGWAIGGLERF